MKKSADYLQDCFKARELAWKAKKEQLEFIKKTEQGSISRDTKSFNQEFRTLHLDFGRRTGNSYWMSHKCLELSLKGNFNCFCFFFSYNALKYFWQNITPKIQKQKELLKSSMEVNICWKPSELIVQKGKITTDMHVYTFQTMDRGIKHIPNSYAFVDVSCMLGVNKLDKIMESDQWEIICLL